MSLLTLLVLFPFIFGGLAYFLIKKASSLDANLETDKQAQKAWTGYLIAGVVSALISVGAAVSLLDLAPALIKQEHIATQVIRVLDEHGWDKACEHIDCQALVDRATEKE